MQFLGNFLGKKWVAKCAANSLEIGWQKYVFVKHCVGDVDCATNLVLYSTR